MNIKKVNNMDYNETIIQKFKDAVDTSFLKNIMARGYMPVTKLTIEQLIERARDRAEVEWILKNDFNIDKKE